MKNLFTVSLLLSILLSCSTFLSPPAQDQFFEHLQGDWKTEEVQAGPRKRSFTFSFQDSLCTYKYPWSAFSKYKVNSDTLIIQKRNRASFVDSNSLFFKIERLAPDSIKLSFLSKSAQELFNSYPPFSNSISLNRIKKKNHIIPSKISFHSSACYGTCPSLELEIDSKRNLAFYGHSNTIKLQGHRGVVPPAIFANILDQIRNLSLDSLKESYRAPWTDDQECCIDLEYNGKKLNSCAYGQYEEPLPLRLLFNTLIQLHKHMDLKPASIEKNLYPHKEEN